MAFALCKCWGARWIHPTVTRWPACRPSICSLMRAVLRPWCGSNIANLNHKISRTEKVLVALTCKNDQSFRCARKRAHACSHTWCAFLHRKWPGGLVPQLLFGSQRQTARPLGFRLCQGLLAIYDGPHAPPATSDPFHKGKPFATTSTCRFSTWKLITPLFD